MKKAIAVLLLFTVISSLFLPSCMDTEDIDTSNNTTTNTYDSGNSEYDPTTENTSADEITTTGIPDSSNDTTNIPEDDSTTGAPDSSNDTTNIPEDDSTTGTPDSSNDTTNVPEDITTPENTTTSTAPNEPDTEPTPETTTTVVITPPIEPSKNEAEEMIAKIDALTNKRINEIRNTEDNITVTGTKYYVSADGNDSNSGKSPFAAWKTMEKVNSYKFSKGDGVFFRGGDTFRGHIQAQDGVTYAAYGKGAKPILIANEITDGTYKSSWSLLEGTTNIWVYHKEVADQGNIIFNNGDAGCAYKVTPSYKNGKAHVQLTNTEFDVKKELDKNLEFVCLADSIINSKGVPKVEDPACVGKLYLRCDWGNPGQVYDSIEFAPRVFTINAYANDVTIDNLCFKYTGAHAIGGGNCVNLKVTNCEFGWIGGTILNYQDNGNPVRYGNAVQTIGNVNNYVVTNNYIYQVYDAGITHQIGKGSGSIIMQNILYADNVILYCSYSIEYFLGEKYDNSTRYMDNIVIENNIMRYAGFGFGNQRRDVHNPAHIKGWDHANYLKEGSEFVIRNNIMDRSCYMMIHCGAEKAEYLPIFEDNIWVHYETGTSSLGKYSANPTTQKPFTEKNLEDLGIERDPEYYITTTNAPTIVEPSRPDSGNNNESEDTSMFEYLNNTYYKLTEDKELKVVYIGGSVTSGYGATDQNTKSWRALITDWLQDSFPSANVKGVNAAIGGTGSYLANFRFDTDVAPHNPDLLFIEFCINDRYNAQSIESVTRTSETLIRKAYALNPNMDIVYVLVFDQTTDRNDYDQLVAHRNVAQKYGLPFIQLNTRFYDMLKETGTQFRDYFSDGVHPADAGYAFYAEVIKEFLASELIQASPVKTKLNEKDVPSKNVSALPLMMNARMIYANKIDLSSSKGWSFQNQNFSYMGMKFSGRVFANTPGSKLVFTFEGTDMGLFFGAGPNMGKISCSIDGGEAFVIDGYKNMLNPKEAVVAWNLEYGTHTVVIELLSEKNADSTGTNFEIGAILVN